MNNFGELSPIYLTIFLIHAAFELVLLWPIQNFGKSENIRSFIATILGFRQNENMKYENNALSLRTHIRQDCGFRRWWGRGSHRLRPCVHLHIKFRKNWNIFEELRIFAYHGGHFENDIYTLNI